MDISTQMSPIERFKAVAREGRWLQNDWHCRLDGKDYLCLAAAWGAPGEIDSPEQCPTNLYPAWLFELMPQLDDSISKEDVPWLFNGFADRADAMAKLSPEAWERIRTGFLIGVVRQAVESAGAAQGDNNADYWKQVAAACDQVCAALESGDENAAAYAANEAAYAAANAANAAAYAAANAANAAAYAAYAAANEAANAANEAAYAAANAAANEAAYAAAYAANEAANAAAYAAARKTCEILFKMIDAECDSFVAQDTNFGFVDIAVNEQQVEEHIHV